MLPALLVYYSGATQEAWPVIPAPTQVILNSDDDKHLQAGQLNRIQLSRSAEELDLELLRSLTFLSVADVDDKNNAELPIALKDAPDRDAAAGEIVLSLECASPGFPAESYRLTTMGTDFCFRRGTRSSKWSWSSSSTGATCPTPCTTSPWRPPGRYPLSKYPHWRV